MTVYIIQLAQPLGDPTRPRMSARFYVGYAESPSHVYTRLENHRKGRGSRMLAAAAARGISFDVVAVTPGTRDTERLIKNRGHYDRTLRQIQTGTFKAVV